MDPGERILVTFLGPTALNVNFDVAGVNPGQDVVQVTQHVIRTAEYQVSTIGNPGSDGAGLAAVSWTAVTRTQQCTPWHTWCRHADPQTPSLILIRINSLKSHGLRARGIFSLWSLLPEAT